VIDKAVDQWRIRRLRTSVRLKAII